MTAKDLALLVNGEITGNEGSIIKTISPIELIEQDSVVYVEKEKSLIHVLESKASVIIIPKAIPMPKTNKTVVTVDDGKLAFIRILKRFETPTSFSNTIDPMTQIHKTASIHKTVTIMAFTTVMENAVVEEDVLIYPHCYIGENALIKRGTILHPNVSIEKNCIIGENNIIYNGAVIGSDGFGYYDSKGIRHKIPQLGIVETGNNIEIGANTTIDRATLGKTYIGSGTKIDNLVQIAHNCSIGENCYITAQVGIAGSCNIGDRVSFAGQSGVIDHITIGDDVTVLAQSAVTKPIKAGEVVLGFPARAVKEAKKIYAFLSRVAKK